MWRLRTHAIPDNKHTTGHTKAHESTKALKALTSQALPRNAHRPTTQIRGHLGRLELTCDLQLSHHRTSQTAHTPKKYKSAEKTHETQGPAPKAQATHSDPTRGTRIGRPPCLLGDLKLPSDFLVSEFLNPACPPCSLLERSKRGFSSLRTRKEIRCGGFSLLLCPEDNSCRLFVPFSQRLATDRQTIFWAGAVEFLIARQ